MNYKGAYSGDTSYSVGDVTVYGGVAYELFETAAAGTTPHDTHKWRRVPQPMQDMVMMFHGALGDNAETVASLSSAVAALSAVVPDSKTLVLATDDGSYEITVDDSGDTPELAVTAVTPEEDEG